MKYLGINLTKSVGDLFEENYKLFKKEIEQNLKRYHTVVFLKHIFSDNMVFLWYFVILTIVVEKVVLCSNIMIFKNLLKLFIGKTDFH